MKKIHIKFRAFLKSFVLISVLAFNTMLSADDTEVFYSVNVSKPNLLFILDMSGSMNESIGKTSLKVKSHKLIREINFSLNDGFQYWNRTKTGGGRSKLGGGWGYDWTESLQFTPNKMNAVRFDNLGIPKNAKITKAFVQFTATGTRDNKRDTDINIYVENSNNAKYFYHNNRYSDASMIIGSHRVLYEAIKWEDVPKWQRWEKTADQRTPDLKENIQRIIDKTDWQPDNGIAILFDTIKGKRVAKSFDWQGWRRRASPPEIHIEYETQEGVSNSKLNVIKSAFRKVLSTAPSNVNVGLMKYASQDDDDRNDPEDKRAHHVSGISFPITDINGFAANITKDYDDRDNLLNPDERATVRTYLPDVVNTWVGYGGTPIVDALYEAALYFRGDKMHYGKNYNNTTDTVSRTAWVAGLVDVPYASGSHPSTYVGGDEIKKNIHEDGRSSITDKTYISPIKSSCQPNYIVLMSDGYPTYYTNEKRGDALGPFANVYAGSTDNSDMSQSVLVDDFTKAMNGASCEVKPNKFRSGTCGPELTHFLASHDQSPFAGVQTIKTFTVGFGDLGDNTVKYLQKLATYEGKSPKYYDASDEETLVRSFRRILTEVSKPSGTLASPGYSVNIKNGLAHEKDIYIPVFDRKNSSVWSGNLKKFKIVDKGDGQRRIQGSNNKDAVDDLGSFTSDAHDYWSESPAADGDDGKDVLKGGIANLINKPDERKLFSNIISGELKNPNNEISADNNSFLAALAQIINANSDERKLLANFIRGWKKGDKAQGARKHMGDMLHSEPLIITYKKGDKNGVGKEQYLFAATNEGYLHVFDTKSGKEKFAFMPKELFKNIDPQFQEAGTAKDHKYGIDGQLSYWQNNDHVYVYFGLRRGGRSYYALDVTNLDSPKLMWSKTGGSGDLTSLGQSWSKPYLARVRMANGQDKEVVIVSGGYDPAEDRNDQEASNTVEATQGNDIFIFDAVTGDRIWSLRKNMNNHEIINSIPGGVRALDVNQNGAIDRLYFADTGGNIWRLDLSENLGSSSATDTHSSLVKLASLGGNDEQARKFYNEPDVAVMRHKGKTVYALTIGSGFRAHPMDKTIEDRFFVIRDNSPYSPLITSGDKKNFDTITLDDLATIEMTETTNGNVTLTHAKFDEANKGWTLKMPKVGEKVLANSIVVNGTVIFTALVPEVLTSGTNIDPCAAPATYGRMYAINIETGEAILDLDKNNNTKKNQKVTKVIDDNDIVTRAITKVIPDKIRQIFNPPSLKEEKDSNGNVIKTECVHDVDLRSGKRNTQVDSYDACRLESLYWNNPQK